MNTNTEKGQMIDEEIKGIWQMMTSELRKWAFVLKWGMSNIFG